MEVQSVSMAIGFATALMTAFYMFRLIYLTFWSPSRVASHEIEHHIHESPASMTVPLVVLAFFSLTAGWLGWPASLGGSNHFEKFLEPVFANHVEAEAPTGEEGHAEPSTCSWGFPLLPPSPDCSWQDVLT